MHLYSWCPQCSAEDAANNQVHHKTKQKTLVQYLSFYVLGKGLICTRRLNYNTKEGHQYPFFILPSQLGLRRPSPMTKLLEHSTDIWRPPSSVL